MGIPYCLLFEIMGRNSAKRYHNFGRNKKGSF